MDSKYFYTLGYNLVLKLFCYSNCSRFGGWEPFSWLPCPIKVLDFCLCVFWAISYFLAVQDTPAPFLEWAVSPRSPSYSLYSGTVLETSIWVLYVLIVTGRCCCFYLTVSAYSSRKCVCMLICVCTHIYKYFYKMISIAHLTCLFAFFFFFCTLYSTWYILTSLRLSYWSTTYFSEFNLLFTYVKYCLGLPGMITLFIICLCTRRHGLPHLTCVFLFK